MRKETSTKNADQLIHKHTAVMEYDNKCSLWGCNSFDNNCSLWVCNSKDML